MPEYNSAIQMSVLKDGYHARNHRAAIDDAYRVSKILGVPVNLNLYGQINFFITPINTPEEIEGLKAQKIIFGV